MKKVLNIVIKGFFITFHTLTNGVNMKAIYTIIFLAISINSYSMGAECLGKTEQEVRNIMSSESSYSISERVVKDDYILLKYENDLEPQSEGYTMFAYKISTSTKKCIMVVLAEKASRLPEVLKTLNDKTRYIKVENLSYVDIAGTYQLSLKVEDYILIIKMEPLD